VLPADSDEVARVLQCAMMHRIAVVPFGGGTSVVGGVTADRGSFTAVVALDMRRLDTLTELDPISRTATLGAGLSGPQAEELLAAHGFTLGHFPQSFRFATIGGYAATRSSGQASSGYGRFDDMIERLDVVTPMGRIRAGRAPASAAGPDLRELFAGSEGVLGVVTAVTVRIRPIPEQTAYQSWSFPDFRIGMDAVRHVAQSGIVPTMIRLSDEVETGFGQVLSGRDESAASGCLAVVIVEGAASAVEWRQRELAALLHRAGGTELGPRPARQWAETRFDAPYLRDGLLDVGVLVETLETATSWSNLTRVKAAVTEALTATLTGPTLVMCHVSHVYPAGGSLYFTVVTGAGVEPIRQWAGAKRRACDAIMGAGATITHHHAVGSDHRAWLTDEIGESGVAIIRAVKNVVDPAGILNPGTLLP
jgi:alkyldihydroxyacetonephosphate synthase